MRTVKANASDNELIECISEWSDLMAADDFAAAVDFLHPPSQASGAETWTVQNLKTYIQNYGSWEPLADGRSMHVTPIGSAQGSNPFPYEVMRYEERQPHIEFTLPLNGEWSDLTAIFDVVNVDGRWAFVLYDLRVL